MKKYNIILLITAIVLFLGMPVVEAANSDYYGLIPHIYKGDHKAIVEAIDLNVSKNPNSPSSAILMNMLPGFDSIAGYDKCNSILEKYISNVERSSFKDKNEKLFAAYLIKEQLDSAYLKKKTPLYSNYKMITKWNYSRRYRKYGSYDIVFPFAPEKSTHSYDSNLKTDTSSGFVYPYEYVYPADGIYYFNSVLESSKPVNLVIESNSYYKVFINNQTVLTNMREKIFRTRRVIRLAGSNNYNITIKMDVSSNSRFRVITTNHDYSPVSLKTSLKNIETGGEPTFTEKMLYPYNELKSSNTDDSLISLASYFYYLQSLEYRSYYAQLKAKNQTNVYDALEAMDTASIFNKKTAYGKSAWKTLSRIWKEDQNFIPVQYYKFKEILNSGNITNAIETANEIRKKSDYYKLEIDLLDLYYEKSFDNLFLKQAKLIKEKFPYSKVVDSYLAQYYSLRDIEKSHNIIENLLGKTNNQSVIKRLIKIYRESNEYEKALSLIDQYDVFLTYDKELTRAEIYIDYEKYDKAKKILQNLAIQNETPSVLYYLGLISQHETGSVDPYWQKLEKYYPEYDFPRRYLEYRKNKKMLSIFENYRNKKFIDEEIKKFTSNSNYHPQSVVYRSYLFRIFESRKMKMFKEELLYIKTSGDVDSKGEYNIPVNNNYKVLRARVYQRDGSYSDSYRLNSTPRGTYITLNGISRNSLLHIAYELSDQNSNYYGSELSNSNFLRLQNFEETIKLTEVKIITPFQDLMLYNNKNIPIKSEKNNGNNIISFVAENINRIDKETSSGDARRTLLSYGFTTITSPKEFVNWYRGYFPDGKNIDYKNYLIINDKSNDKDKIINIYNYISKKIATAGGLNYSPSNPEPVLLNKIGSVEDKVFLAKQLLKQNGIESYPALVKDSYILTKNINLANIYDNILLYVPEHDLWLDFSSEYYPCGIVNDYNSNQNAVIIKDSGIEQKKVQSKNDSLLRTECNMSILSNGLTEYSVTLTALGNKNYLRRYFKDKRQHSLFASAFLSMFEGKFIPDTYELSDVSDYTKDLMLSSRGKVYGFFIAGKDSISFDPFIRQTRFINYIRENKRTQDIVITTNEFSDDSYIITLPEEYIDQKIDLAQKYKWKDAYVDYKIIKEKGSRILTVSKKIYFPKIIITPKEYAEFYNFCVKVYRMENYRVVLKK